MTKAIVLCDLQYGSTGKGLAAGYIANETPLINVCVSANMPNAGHTYINRDGHKFIFKVLPCAATSQHVKAILVGPGAIYSEHRLWEEVEMLERVRGDDPTWQVLVHPAAWRLDPNLDPDFESSLLTNDIGSTRQGVLGAMVRKLSRNGIQPPPTLPFHKRIVYVSHEQYRGALDWAARIMVEGAQGFSLGVNEKFYPFCTSRQCTPAQILADCGIPVDFHFATVGVARTYPIRVGGNSGGWYPDQWEVSFEEIGQPQERTTVTNKVRRIATFSYEQIQDAMWETRPDFIFLNFMNYLRTQQEGEIMFNAIEGIGQTLGQGVGIIKYMGFGPAHADVSERDLNNLGVEVEKI